MAETSGKRVQLEPEDRIRMQRLSEEVHARLTEMSLIFSRVLGIDMSGDGELRFKRSKGTQHTAARGNPIEIVCTPEGCGCYVDPPGICEFPCGSAGPL